MKLFDEILEEKKLDSKSGYYKVGVSDKSGGKVTVVEVAQKSSVDSARQAYAKKGKKVFVQPASKQDFMDYSDGKTVKWVTTVKGEILEEKKLAPDFKVTWKELIEELKKIKDQNGAAYVNIPGGPSFQRITKVNNPGGGRTPFIEIEGR